MGGGKAVVMSHTTIDRVMAYSPDAFVLLTILKRHHWGRDFVLARAMAASDRRAGQVNSRFFF